MLNVPASLAFLSRLSYTVREKQHNGAADSSRFAYNVWYRYGARAVRLPDGPRTECMSRKGEAMVGRSIVWLFQNNVAMAPECSVRRHDLC